MKGELPTTQAISKLWNWVYLQTIPRLQYSLGLDAIPTEVIAGAFLGNLFIIPLRKQMIDLERLRFPSGVAVAEVLRSPGAGLDTTKRF